ncbi:unnamed protein product [Meganyctiphanes norvegica]|uniref:C-type lectin domain-containing protein n=1 Tax=Meganyctiphanes norvegica TaxID=48144 RepID=A0AAV2SKJ2_MEGNR
MQRFEILLDNKMDFKMDLIKKEMETKFDNLETKMKLMMEQISNNITTHQDSMARDLQSVKTRVESYEQSFADLKTLHFSIKPQLTDNLAHGRATQNLSSSQNINDLNDTIYDLKTLTRESKIILNEIKWSIEDCKGTSNTTTQQLNDILENMEELNQNRMESDNETMNSTKMTSKEVEGCPSGFFEMSSQCFKMFRDRKRSWFLAKTKCEQEGSMLAQPGETVAQPLQTYLYETFGERSHVWLGAQGDGTKFVYEHGGLVLDNDSPLWYHHHPGSHVSAGYCLVLMADASYYEVIPSTPYWATPCSSNSYYALCEAK